MIYYTVSRPCRGRHVFVVLALFILSARTANSLDPVVCTAQTNFVGYDGQWSPISIRVGTPEQWLSVMPSTLSQETWAIGPASCDGTIACQSARGGLFFSNQSTTFQDLGFYELGYDPELGNSQSGYYGLDTISLNDNVVEQKQIVALLNTSGLWVGELGLGVQQTRISGSENRLPLLSSLVQNSSMIPSHSYGYTAGASYLLGGVPASLTLGGVDQSRFSTNDGNFTLNSDYAPIVAINSISVSTSLQDLPPTWNVNPLTLLEDSEAEVFTIDSSTPYLWMPQTVCDRFADALGLYYNETLEIYMYNSTLTSQKDLQSFNLTFTFLIGSLPGSTGNIELTMSYDAFNLELSYGYPGFDGNYTSPPLPYFPLRQSSGSTEFILGRAFLQETYLAVDYERNSFNLYQAVITQESISNVDLLAITRPADSIFPGPRVEEEQGGLSTGAKAGIAVGAALLVLVLGVLVWFFLKKRKASSNETALSEKSKRRSLFARSPKSPGSNTTVSELIGDKRQPTELTADRSNSRFELPANNAVEMAGAEVSPTFFQDPGSRRDTGLRNDPRNPAEIGQQQAQSGEKEEEARAHGSQRSASPVPPYSPEQAQRLSNSISPNSVRNSQGFGTVSSGEQGISPVGNNSGRGSERNSNSIPSPVSPEATMSRSFQRSNQPSEPGSSEGSYGQHLTPQLPGRGPSRSTSRSSRFVEEGLDNNSTEDPHSSSRSARFSWED